jgi:DNA primase
LISALNSLLLKKSKEKVSKIKNDEDKQSTESPVALVGELPEGIILPEAEKTDILSEIDNLLRPSISYKEEGIVRLLFNYADKILEGTQDTVCDFVMREMEDITFLTPTYQRVLAVFREEWQHGRTLTGKDFMNYQDSEIQRLAVDMMIEKYTVSENWFGKFDIRVPHESENLMDEAHSQILRLKQEVIKGRLAENQKALVAASSFEEQMQLLRVQKQYKEIEKQIADILGNVVR